MFRRHLLIPLLAACLIAAPAFATWSIVVVNTRTGEVAVAVATCLENFNLRRTVPVIVPERGAAAVQCLVDGSGASRILIYDNFQLGVSPTEILTLLEQQVSGFSSHQYGIVDVVGRAAAYTGPPCGQWKGEIVGQSGELVYAIQGNVLAGSPVIQAAETALLSTPGDLAEKLMAAMEAADAMGGDGRCSCSPTNPTGCGSPPPSFTKSAHCATMLIARPGDPLGICNSNGCAREDLYLVINIADKNASDPSPILEMRTEYDLWRASLAGRPDALLSTVQVLTPEVAHGATAPVTVEIALRDVNDQPLTQGGAVFTVSHDALSAGLSTVQNVVDHGNGSYTVELAPGAAPGLDRLRVTVDDGVLPVTLWPPAQLLHLAPAAQPFNDRTAIAELNLGGDDLQPCLLPDGLTCYSLSDFGGVASRRVLAKAARPALGAPFGAPVPVPITSGSSVELFDIWVSADELELIGCGFYPGPSPEQLFRTTRPSVNDPFAPLELISELDSGLWEGGPWLSASEMEMVFHSGRGASFDLYRTRRYSKQGPWLPPQRLAELDSGGDERYPLWLEGETRLVYTNFNNFAGGLYYGDRQAGDVYQPGGPLPGALHPPQKLLVVGCADVYSDQLWVSDVTLTSSDIQALTATPASLSAVPASLSAAAGGTIDFTLDAGPAWAGSAYYLAASGTLAGPGFLTLDVAMAMPYDAITAFVVAQGNQPPFFNFQGGLNAGGAAAAQLNLSPGQLTNPSLLDRDYLFSFLAILGSTAFASNAVTVHLAP